MLAIAAWASSVGASTPARVLSVEICCDSFEIASPDWTLTGHVNGPRWNHVTSGVGYGKAYEGTRAMWFGDPATGEFGGPGGEIEDGYLVYSGTLTSNYSVLLPNETYVFMKFWSWEKTEMSIPLQECYQDLTCSFDVRRVWISSVQAPAWVKIWDTHDNSTVEEVWHQVTLNVSNYRGQDIYVRFEFNTVDARNNDAPTGKPGGWFVDSIGYYSFTPSDFIYLPVVARNATP